MQPWPEARLERAPGPGQGSATRGVLAGFHTWCAACHLSADSVPPNFLAGPAGELEARIRQCAPRIYIRLAMARLPASARDIVEIDVMGDVLGQQPQVTHTEPRAGDVRDSQADNSRLRALFPEVQPVPLEEGVRATVDWFRTLPDYR